MIYMIIIIGIVAMIGYGLVWFKNRATLSEVEREVSRIEREGKRTEGYYRLVAQVAIYTLAVGAILSTSASDVNRIFTGNATPSQYVSIAIYMIAVLVGNTMMFAAAKNIQYAHEIKKEASQGDWAAIIAVICTETLSFLYFLWSFEGLAFSWDRLVPLIIVLCRPLIISTSAVFLELWIAPGVSPARIRAMMQKYAGTGVLTDLIKVMSNTDISTQSKANMYAATLKDHDTPSETLKHIANTAGEMQDTNGNALVQLAAPGVALMPASYTPPDDEQDSQQGSDTDDTSDSDNAYQPVVVQTQAAPATPANPMAPKVTGNKPRRKKSDLPSRTNPSATQIQSDALDSIMSDLNLSPGTEG